MAESEPTSIDFTNHVVLLGWSPLADRIVRELVVVGRPLAVVTQDPDARDLIRERFDPENVRVHLAPLNDWATFDQVNIEESLKVFVNLDDEEESLVAILNLKALYDGLEFDVVLDNPELEDTFYAAGVTYAVATRNLASRLAAGHLFEPDVATYTSELISASEEPGTCDLRQYELDAASDWVGATWGELFWALKNELGCVAVGRGRPTAPGTERELQTMPPDDAPLQAGDSVVVVASVEASDRLEAFFGTQAGLWN